MDSRNLDTINRHDGAAALDSAGIKAVFYKVLENGESKDKWLSNTGCERLHLQPREDLFLPLRVAGASPGKMLCNARTTTGWFLDNGEAFSVTDSWTARASSTRSLGRRWIGCTQFMKKASSIEEKNACLSN